MYRLRQLILLVGDLACLYLGLYLAVAARYWEIPGDHLSRLLLPFNALFFTAVIIAFIAGLYDVGRIRNNWRMFRNIIITAMIWTVCGAVFFYAKTDTEVSPKTILALTALFGFGLMAFWRYTHNKFLSVAILKTNIVFAGITTEAIELIKVIQNRPQLGYEVVGIIDSSGQMVVLPNEINLVPIASNLGELENKGVKQVHIIVITPLLSRDANLQKELYDNLFRQIEMVDIESFYEEIMGRIPPFTFSESWFLTNFREQRKKIYDNTRKIVDYSAAIVIGVVFCLTLPFVALAIKLTSPGPIFFKQERVGHNGRIFKIFKYRTMKALNHDGSAELEGPQWAGDKDSRIIAVGQILRKTRLDELPQFLNILRGEMGIIGPRPERPEFVRQLVEKMPYYNLRHLIKPGITGWAQINNSYYGTIAENLRKLEYDLYYIKNRGPVLDISIILRTLNTLARMAGR